MTELVIGIDVGGTTIKAALFDFEGRDYDSSTRPTPRQLGPDAVVTTIIDVVRELRTRVPEAAQLRAIGLVVPGVVDAQHGVAVYATNLGWRDLPLRRIVAEAVDLPVIVDHDVRAAGLAELELGAGHGVREMIFVALGTGIAAAVITNGRVLSGASNRAGELGHLPVFPDGERCACGQRGCTETYASGASLARRYSIASGTNDATASEVISRAAAGDPLAQGVFRDAITALGRALVNYVLIMDPEVIVLGGGLSRAEAALLDPLAREVQGGLAWRSAPTIATGRFTADAGRRGAALLAWHALNAAP